MPLSLGNHKFQGTEFRRRQYARHRSVTVIGQSDLDIERIAEHQPVGVAADRHTQIACICDRGSEQTHYKRVSRTKSAHLGKSFA